MSAKVINQPILESLPDAAVLVAVSTVADGSMLDSARRDDPAIVHNRQKWLGSLGLTVEQTTLVRISYAHGDNYCRYRSVTPAQMGEGMRGGEPAPADALVTTTPGHALFLPIADCVATTLYDPKYRVLMLAHLGRHSLEQDGGVRAVEYLQTQFGSDPASLQAWLAPTVGKTAYPIFKLGGMGMKEAVYDQLARAGVAVHNITDDARDTALDANYYSHSEFLKGNKPEDGRFAMVAVMPEVS